MRAIHVVPAISEEAAGPSYSVPRLCESLIGVGVDVQLAALDWAPAKLSLSYLKTFPVTGCPRRLGFSYDMKAWLKQEADTGHADIIHNHSLWMMPNVYSGKVILGSRTQLVVSPRGTLSPYALNINKLQKKIFWNFLQKPALDAASCFHATAECEYEDIRRQGFKQPVCVLPNGIDIPPSQAKSPTEKRTLLFLGRIHPKKGIDNLLYAWKEVEYKFPDWELNIAGPDNGGYLAEMQMLVTTLKLRRVSFLGAKYGAEKLQAYRNASLFVLPTHSENFGMTVAESLAAGTPAIVSKGAPWGGLELYGAGWWIDVGIDSLIACLEQALAVPPEVHIAMGLAGREWMEKDFSWGKIGQEFELVYKWLLGKNEPPNCVIVD